MNDTQFLNQIRVASPCPANWDEMTGDARARFCAHCQKHVYNLSAMTAAEATALVREKEGKLCARFYRRRDGTMLTADCPVSLQRIRERFERRLTAIAATAAVLLFGIGCQKRSTHVTGTPPPLMGEPQPAVFGMIAPPNPVTNHTPIVGDIAMPMGEISIPTMGKPAVTPARGE